jgi:hypothetical protein
MVSKRRLLALAVFVVPWFFWLFSIASASSGGFKENEWAVQLMVLGGALSMVAASIAELW